MSARSTSAALLCATLLLASAAHGDASRVKSDETVVLFTVAAYPAPGPRGGRWVVPLHGWITELEDDSILRGAAAWGLVEAAGRAEADAGTALFRERFGWFVADNERGKRLGVEVAGTRAVLPPSGADGHFRGRVLLDPAHHPAGAPLQVRVALPPGDGRAFHGRVLLVPDEGLAVVSDVDDTIKVTHVLDRRRMLDATFFEPFAAVPGMAALYQAWEARGAAFFYVSGSPWQLYLPLAEFLGAEGFPLGPLVLREFRLKDRRALNLLAPARDHKVPRIRELLRRWPNRRFVLVGDAGESDPEIYGELARAHPGRIERILIRRLDGDRMTPARWRRAFRGVAHLALEFRRAEDLPADLREGRFLE